MTLTIECGGHSCTKTPPSAQLKVFHPNGTMLSNIPDMSKAPCTQSFPHPAVGFSGVNPSWAIRDAPRFVPNPSGVVPANVSDPPYPTGTGNTSGFDLTNNALDVYVFLPASVDEARYGYAGLRSEFLQLTGAIPPLPNEAFGTWFSWCT